MGQRVVDGHVAERGAQGTLRNVRVGARGGDSAPSPLWADKSELIADYPAGLIQVVGHTPVTTVTNVDGLWFCDTMSTLPNGLPIGDSSMLLYTPGTEPMFNVVKDYSE